jgi:hypothetical protein
VTCFHQLQPWVLRPVARFGRNDYRAEKFLFRETRHPDTIVGTVPSAKVARQLAHQLSIAAGGAWTDTGIDVLPGDNLVFAS